MESVPSVSRAWPKAGPAQDESIGTSTPPSSGTLFASDAPSDSGTGDGGSGDATTSGGQRGSKEGNHSSVPTKPTTLPQPSAGYFSGSSATRTSHSDQSSPGDPSKASSSSPLPLASGAGGGSSSSGAGLSNLSPTLTPSQRGGGIDCTFSTAPDAALTPAPAPSTSPTTSGSNSNGGALLSLRDPLFLPRRNHTIGAGVGSHRRRLDTHFRFPTNHTPTSPGQNSLSAITGGREFDDDEWETMIKSRVNLVPGEDDREELGGDSTGAMAWKTSSSNLFSSSHRRFPSQPTSVSATPSFLSGSHSPVVSKPRGSLSHQRSESAHVDSLEQGPFASAGLLSSFSPDSRYERGDAGMIRRHQSLNHASGRSMANRLQASTRGNNFGAASDSSNSSLFFPPTSTNTDRRSPAKSFGSVSPALYSGMSGVDRTTPDGSTHPSSSISLSSSLMDAHARLSRMAIQPNPPQPIRESSADSSTAVTNDGDHGKKRLPSLITNREVLERSAAFNHSHGRKEVGGPASASAYVPPIGHGHHRRESSSSASPIAFISKSDLPNLDSNKQSDYLQGPFSAMAVSNPWSHQPGKGVLGQQNQLATAKEEESPQEGGPGLLSSPRQQARPDNASASHPSSMDNMALSIALLQQRLLQQQPSASIVDQHRALHQGIHSGAMLYGAPGAQTASQQWPFVGGSEMRGYPSMVNLPAPPLAAPPTAIDPALAALITAKGYNPTTTQFNVNPTNARFFVIKSFTEDDVQRSLKYEIWASTDKGNQRLDKAFRERSADGGEAGPIYLFFSVNASGHFCGMAQMLTALDYNSTSNVWVQEGKWKGTFRVRWIYIKDVPNTTLRHIRLTNTAERKPITQSRDTQELPTEGGKEVLRIMAEYQSKTTLLQDWLFYEQQALQQQQHQQQQQQQPSRGGPNFWHDAPPFHQATVARGPSDRESG